MSANSLKRLLDCERRLWRSEHLRRGGGSGAGGPAAARGDHEDMLGEKNRALEDRAAAAIANLAGPIQRPGVTLDEAAAETTRLLREGNASLRRPVLLSPDGRRVATPAFVIRDGDTLVIRDVRLAHRPEKRRDNRLRVAFAGWIARELTGREVSRLEIVNGHGQLVHITPESDDELSALTARALELMGDSPEPEVLLSHSTCQDCEHYRACWDRAERERRMEVVPSVTPQRAAWLRNEGVRTFDQLAARAATSFHRRELRDAAPVMLAEARAFATAAPVWLADPGIPRGRTPVWFDVESDADGEAAEVPVYVWGVAVGEARESESVLAELSRAGDRAAWQQFGERVLHVHGRHPDAVWVHWNLAEPMWIERYTAKYGIAPEVLAVLKAPGAMFDLHKALEKSVRLPLRSTSIKFVAPWLGFEWSNPKADAAWSTAQLHRARRAKDAATRDALLAEVLRYNADDLWAMRAVWGFLRERGRPRAEA